MSRRHFIVAVAILALLAPAIAAASMRTASGTTVVLVINPSKRAVATEVRHIVPIFRQVSSLPALWFVGIYEQHSYDDGAPFDRPFVSTQTPPLPPRPSRKSLDPCSETSGTTFQRKECAKKHEDERGENTRRLAAWHEQNEHILVSWQKTVVRTLRGAGGATEESHRWNLAHALARAGADLSISPGGQKCLVLLGGLAVQRPPTNADLSSLKGSKIVVTGWNSSNLVQQLWTKRLTGVGATIEFLPTDITDLALNGAIARCVNAAA